MLLRVRAIRVHPRRIGRRDHRRLLYVRAIRIRRIGVIRAAEVPARVLLRDGPDHAARVAGRDHAGGNIMRYDAARADHAARADGHARTNDHAATDPHAVPDHDRRAVFIAARARIRVHRMPRRIDGHVRPEQHVVSDADLRDVEKRAVEIGKKAVADMHMPAVVAVDRRLDAHPLSHAAEDLPEHGLQRRVVGVGRVVSGRAPAAGKPLLRQTVLRSQIGQAQQHPLPVIHAVDPPILDSFIIPHFVFSGKHGRALLPRRNAAMPPNGLFAGVMRRFPSRSVNKASLTSLYA